MSQTLLIVYTISLPLGIRKAVHDGTQFDIWTSFVILIGYAIPAFILAMLLIILFCGGEYFDWFPLRGLISDNYSELTFVGNRSRTGSITSPCPSPPWSQEVSRR